MGLRANTIPSQPTLHNINYGQMAIKMVNSYVYSVAAGKVIAANSAGNELKCVGHSVLKFDMIRFTGGVLVGKEFFVTEVVDANTIKVNYFFKDSELPTAGDTFDQLRSITPTGANDGSQLVTVTTSDLTPVDFIDAGLYVAADVPFMSLTANNIPARSAAPLQIVAALAASVKKLEITDDIGELLVLYSDAAGNVPICTLPLAGGERLIELAMGSSVYIRNVKDATINTDTYLGINFLG